MKFIKNHFSLFIAALGLLVFINGCQSEEEQPKLPVITSFTPQAGEPGTIVKITGANFGLNPTFYFNNVRASLSGGFNDASVEVEIIVPVSATTGKIRLQTSEGEVESSDVFQVPGLPVISSFSPTEGAAGTEVVIKGQNFSATSQVKFFNDQTAQITARTETQLTVVVPANAKMGKLIVSTAVGSTTSVDDFIANPPTITSVLSEFNGTPVTVSGPSHRLILNGTNFSPTAAENKIRFNGKEVTLVSQSNITNQLVFIVPSGVTTGKITLTIGNYTVEYNQVIEVPAGEWKRLDDFPASRYDAKVFVIGNDAYYGGTPNPNSGYAERKDFWKFNAVNKTWTAVADITSIKYNYVSFTAGNKGYVGGLYSELWEYNPASDQWTQKAAPSIYGGKAVGINGKGYVLNDANITSFSEYDPSTDKWTAKAAFPLGSLYYPATFVLNNKMYVVSGMTQTSPVVHTKEVYEYDPSNNIWTKKADFPGSGRVFASGFAVNGYGYVGGGQQYGNGFGYEDVWRYDPVQDKWFTSVPHPGYFTNPFVIGSKAYSGLFGGATLGKNYFYEFTP